MLAIISDIHSNLEALSVVMDDIRRRKVEMIVCLGDVIGYGPDPGACLDMVRSSCSTVIFGNHDYAVLYEPNRFNLGAENAVFWTRKQLQREKDLAVAAQRWRFLGERDTRATLDGTPWGLREITLVHGSPRRPVNEYVFPDDTQTAPTKLQGCMDRFEHVCFLGHTHVPGAFFATDGVIEFYTPEDLGDVLKFTDEKVMINVGSVGQPRDRDPRASYVIVEPGKATFVRLEYDAQATMEKVLAQRDLEDYLGTRLIDGR